MKQPPVITSPLFLPLLENLLDLLKGLTPQDWEKPTECGTWRVRDIALHLLGDDLGILSWKRDGFSVSAHITSYEDLIKFINRSNREWVEGTQRISPRLLVDLLAFTGPQVCAFFNSLDPDVIGGAVDWAGPDPAPVWLDLAREFTERWHHQQHIREAVGAPILDQPNILAPVLETFMFAFPFTYREVLCPEGTVIQLTIEGPAGNSWYIQQESGAWGFYQGKPEIPPVSLITMDQDSAWRLFTNGLDPQIARQHIHLQGDVDLGIKIIEMRSILT